MTAQSRRDEPDLGVVVAAHQAAGEIGPCLEALLQAGFRPVEILVVDDGSPDATGVVAEGLGVRVLRNETALRPARARNTGVAAVSCRWVLFVDADVVVHHDVRERLLARIAAEPGIAAIFGSYDASPPAPGLVSRYRNLLHHYTHQAAGGDASTFWTGLGAIRRDVFVAHDGLSPAWEDIEDVEFGLRVTAGGERIVLDPGLQGRHLKAWSLRSMVRTDIHGRARPWTRLLLRGAAPKRILNTGVAHRLAAGAVVAFPVAVAVSVAWAPAALVALGALALFLGATVPFLAFLTRLQGPFFAARAVPVHALHYAAAVTGYVWATVFERHTPDTPGRAHHPRLG